jgi:hypothetical protein
MAKTEVYTWRVDPSLKQSLEAMARDKKTSVASLLDRIVRDWLQKERAEEDDEAMQRRIRAEAAKWIGSIQGNDPTRSERAKEIVRERIRAKHRATQRPD